MLLVAVRPWSSVIVTDISYVPAFEGVPARVTEPSCTEYTPTIPHELSKFTLDCFELIVIPLSLKSFQSLSTGNCPFGRTVASTDALLFLFCVTFVDALDIAS